MKRKVIVRAPALTQTGYGEHGRFVLRALRTMEDEYDIYFLPVNWGQSNWIWEDNEERQWIDDIIQKTALYHHQASNSANGSTEYEMSIQVTIPNEWERLASVNIGVTAGIETTKVAPVWIEKANFMNKIITTSEHSKNVFENTSYQGKYKWNDQTPTNPASVQLKCTTPIEVVHYPIKKYDKVPLNLKLTTPFNFLTIAQWGPRKNVKNTLSWFVEEFIDNPNVGLVVKVFTKGGSILDRYDSEYKLKNMLAQYPDRQCKVYLLHGDMTEEEIHSLYRHPKIKAFVSLSHGEGFGLPHFEAAYSGLPVMAPDWSGHLDFLYAPKKDKQTGKEKMTAHFIKVGYDIVPVPQEAVWEGVIEKDAMWCSPQQGSYKMKLREVYKQHIRFKAQAKTLQQWILKNFTADAQYKKFNDALNYSSIKLLELVKGMNEEESARPTTPEEAAFYDVDKQAKLLSLMDRV